MHHELQWRRTNIYFVRQNAQEVLCVAVRVVFVRCLAMENHYLQLVDTFSRELNIVDEITASVVKVKQSIILLEINVELF